METITFTAKFTFPTESVIGFAKFLGYQETTMGEDGEAIENPESAFDYIAKLAKAHNEIFVTQWADFLVKQEIQKQVDIMKPQMEEQIIKPVKDAITVTYGII